MCIIFDELNEGPFETRKRYTELIERRAKESTDADEMTETREEWSGMHQNFICVWE